MVTERWSGDGSLDFDPATGVCRFKPPL